MATIAELVVEVSANIQGALGGLQRVDNRLQQASRRIGEFAAGLAPVGAALTAVGVVGVRAFADYEASLAELVARTGLAGDELARVEELAANVGRTTMFSSSQAIQAMTEMVASGASVADSMTMLNDVLSLSAVSGLSLGESADALTDVMAMFGLETADATRVVNTLTAAEGASSATTEDLIAALVNVGPVAAAYGLSIEDAAATLAVLSENGIKGAEAGTALKSMLMNMTRTSSETTAAWIRLGISFYDTAGRARPLNQVLADLDTALASRTPEEANELMHDLAGSYGVVALNALLGTKSIDDMMAAMGEQRTAAEIAAAKMDTFGGSAHQLRSSLQQLMIEVMRPFVNEYLRPAISGVTEVVGALADWLAKNPQVAEALGVVGGGLVALTAGAGIASVALGALGSAIGALSAPLVVVALLVGAMAYAIKNNLFGLGDAFDAVVARIEGIAERVQAAFQAGGLRDAGRVLLGELLAGLGDLVAWTRDNITQPVLDELRAIDWHAAVVQPVLDTLAAAVSAVYEAALGIGKAIVNAVIEAAKALPRALASVIDDAIPNKIDLGITSVDLPDHPVADALGIPAMAHGGVVTKPTLALIGEAGPEAVVPLSRLGAGVGRTVTISGPVYVYGVQDPARLLDTLEREAGRRGMRLTYAAGRA